MDGSLGILSHFIEGGNAPIIEKQLPDGAAAAHRHIKTHRRRK